MVKILDDGQWSKFTIVVDGIVKGSRKKWIFYGQADRKEAGAGGSAPSALTVRKCENVDPFIPLKFDSLVLKTHFIESESFLTTFCVNLYNHVQFLKRVGADRKYSQCEIKH